MKGIFAWCKRVFVGGAGEEIESPSRLRWEAFFRKKTAVAALIVLALLFLFVFVTPLLVPMNVYYTDPLQQNVAPGYSMRAIPKALKKDIRAIDGFADFSVGLSCSGKVYVWGNGKNALTKTDLRKVPASVEKSGAAFVAAGKDHILALTNGGELVGWGDKSCGQYGYETVLNALSTPEEFRAGVALDQVRALACGYQVSALVKTDGNAYLWGNKNSVRNLEELARLTGVKKVVFTNSAAAVVFRDGSFSAGKASPFTSVVSSKGRVQSELDAYLVGRKVVEIAATNKCIALVTADGELIVSGVFENGEELLPTLRAGERFVALQGGTRHFVGLTDRGAVYAWGHNAYSQCEIQTENAGAVFAGALQSYATDANGKLLKSAGLKGYLMGTDGRGRDIFARIVHGGKMTLTIGAVAVIVSSAIAIVVGCAAGYLGGAVDTVLMRITEIFSSIPFLPFAMLLSQIIKNYAVSETMRIFIIMLILGALSWTGLARMIRGQVLAEREKEFVTAAKAMGVKKGAIAFRHILPNVASVILVSMTLDFAGCLLTESSLSYLGFGVQQPFPTWGNMLNGCNNSTVIQNYWWQWLFPALFLSLAVVCINVIGDALRDALDPKGKE